MSSSGYSSRSFLVVSALLVAASASSQPSGFQGRWVLALDSGRVTDYGILEIEEADGEWRSARWRVQGTFRGTFPLHHFPFDPQHDRHACSLYLIHQRAQVRETGEGSQFR